MHTLDNKRRKSRTCDADCTPIECADVYEPDDVSERTCPSSKSMSKRPHSIDPNCASDGATYVHKTNPSMCDQTHNANQNDNHKIITIDDEAKLSTCTNDAPSLSVTTIDSNCSHLPSPSVIASDIDSEYFRADEQFIAATYTPPHSLNRIPSNNVSSDSKISNATGYWSPHDAWVLRHGCVSDSNEILEENRKKHFSDSGGTESYATAIDDLLEFVKSQSRQTHVNFIQSVPPNIFSAVHMARACREVVCCVKLLEDGRFDKLQHAYMMCRGRRGHLTSLDRLWNNVLRSMSRELKTVPFALHPKVHELREKVNMRRRIDRYWIPTIDSVIVVTTNYLSFAHVQQREKYAENLIQGLFLLEMTNPFEIKSNCELQMYVDAYNKDHAMCSHLLREMLPNVHKFGLLIYKAFVKTCRPFLDPMPHP